MINKFEGIGIFASISLMALALFFLNLEENNLFSGAAKAPQEAAVITAGENDDLKQVLLDSVDDSGRFESMIIDDIVLGTGESVSEGDTVSVHYIGSLQNGQQFDNSYLSGEPFSFTVGEREVIAGWDKGIVGMKVGGQRILVIPSELAYGKKGYGPIPGNATLVFSIELLSIAQ